MTSMTSMTSTTSLPTSSMEPSPADRDAWLGGSDSPGGPDRSERADTRRRSQRSTGLEAVEHDGVDDHRTSTDGSVLRDGGGRSRAAAFDAFSAFDVRRGRLLAASPDAGPAALVGAECPDDARAESVGTRENQLGRWLHLELERHLISIDGGVDDGPASGRRTNEGSHMRPDPAASSRPADVQPPAAPSGTGGAPVGPAVAASTGSPESVSNRRERAEAHELREMVSSVTVSDDRSEVRIQLALPLDGAVELRVREEADGALGIEATDETGRPASLDLAPIAARLRQHGFRVMGFEPTVP